MRELTAAELDRPKIVAQSASAPVRPPRDARIDALRGAALVTIFVDHVPGNAYEHLTLRNFGFSDAAEGFVLMAGIASGLAYGPAFRPGGDAWSGIARVWRRAWTIYLVHLLVTLAAFAIAAALALWADSPGLFHLNGIDAIVSQPLHILIGLPILLVQLSYANILPLYCVLLLFAPAVLWLAWRTPRVLMAGSVILWATVGELRLNFPLWSTNSVGWQFAPLSWQLLFVVGALVGIRMRQGHRLVPIRPWLVAASAAFLLLALAWVTFPFVSQPLNKGLWQLQQAGAPWMLTSFNKVWETVPRVLHALVLAYFLSALPAVRTICASPLGAPFSLLGRQALPVFALGSVLAFLFQGIKTRTGQDLALDTLMLATGLALQFALAFAKDRWPAR